jgi:hypothetical protein
MSQGEAMDKMTANGTITVTPDDIEIVHGIIWNSFGRYEAEVSAAFIVRLCREKGGWLPFTKAELDAMDARGSFHFNGLDRPEFIEHHPDGTMTVTKAFVIRCAKAGRSPVL